MEKPKNNADIIEFDPFILSVRGREETIEMFGEEYLEEYSCYVPEELQARYKKNLEEFKAIQKELRGIKEAAEKERFGE